MTEKTVNYTDEMVAKMVSVYNPSAPVDERKATVEALASDLGKPVKSIVAKLSNLGIYVKPERVTKTGETVVKKEELATAIGEMLALPEADASSLAKANKSALKAVKAALSEVLAG